VIRVEWRESVWSTLLAVGFAGLGLKTWAEVPMRTDDTWQHRRSFRSEATGEEARWPSDQERKSWTRMSLWLASLLLNI